MGKYRTGAPPYPNLVYSRAGGVPPYISVRGTDQDRSLDRTIVWSVPRTRVDYDIKPRARH